MKMKIYNKGWFGSNSYVLIGENKEAVLIDAGSEADFYLKKEISEDYKIKYVLLTHGHFDHICAGKDLQEIGKLIGISQKDSSFLSNDNNLSNLFDVDYQPFKADFTFVDGEILKLCGLEFKVIATPGHTQGSVCFLCGDMLFSGDTLFCESIGRTDFPTGSYKEIIESIQKKLFTIEKDITVYSGHGESTTLEYEKIHNPYCQAAKK